MITGAGAATDAGADTVTGAATDAGAATGAAHLAGLLARAGGGPVPTPVELAELLWLARHLPAPAARPTDPGAAPGAEPAVGGAGNRAAGPHHATDAPHPRPPPAPHPDHPDVPAPPPAPAGPEARIPLRLPGRPAPAPGTGRDGDPGAGPNGDPDGPSRRPAPDGTYTSLLAPAPPMLPRPLALQRALRPLKRRVPAPAGRELDEEATAVRIARLGAAPQWWLPVLRPTAERWLTLHLVHDAGPTMPVWRPLVRELHTVLAQSGVFRTVELHRLETDGTVRRPGSQESFADGRTVTLLLSDCMGPQWRDGPAGSRWYATLRRWSASMPVALVQPLPERLWRTTALPATTARITAQGTASPNSAYQVDAYALDDLPRDVLPLPVLEASAPWLANWSALVAARGRTPGAVALLGAAPPAAPVDERGRSDVERLSPEELLLRFRSLASPEAFRLAGHLAVGPPELPVMRLVQAAIEKNPQPQHLAEVILSGALIAVPGAAGSYAFRPGVRELLLRTLPRTAHSRTTELLARVGALIDARAGVAAGEFRVAVPGAGNATAGGEPFAAVREESVRRLGGTPPERAAAGRRDLVRGPFGARHPGAIRGPEPGRTAVVVRTADGTLSLLDPERPPATHVPGTPVTYYEVDLTARRSGHRVSLPGSRGGHFDASVELSWHVEDPVAFVRSETTDVSERLLGHVVEEAGRVTRRHPVDRPPSRGRLRGGLRGGPHGWPVPGLSVTCSVRLRPSEAPRSAPQSAPQPDSRPAPRPAPRAAGRRTPPPDATATFLCHTRNVLIGFDGPLVRLYTSDAEKQATRELAALLAELRDPEAALAGEPLSAPGGPTPPLEGRSNPLDLLRAVAGHPLGADLRRRLNRIEERAVSTAAPTPFSDALITTLSSLGRRTAVVADNAPSAVWKYLQAHGRLTGLVTGGVHGRAEDLTRLMPDPDCLLRALERLGATPGDAVLVGSSVAELTAAKAIGLRFLGYTRSEPHRRRLVRAGCELTTASWVPLLQALPNT